MKYSQLTGIIASLAVIGICFLPWSFIASKSILITGFEAEGTNFGKPGLGNLYLSAICILLFLIPKIWAKRINIFVAAFNLSFSIRNFILLSTCQAGECPEKKYGLYLLLLASLIIQFMTFVPKIKIPENK